MLIKGIFQITFKGFMNWDSSRLQIDVSKNDMSKEGKYFSYMSKMTCLFRYVLSRPVFEMQYRFISTFFKAKTKISKLKHEKAMIFYILACIFI